MANDPRSGDDAAPNWTEVAHFPSRLEAEAIGHALDEHGIPFLVKSADIGMFGPGMVGVTPEGAGLLVPAAAVARVRELITCVVDPSTDGVLPADVLPELGDDRGHDDDPASS